MLRIVPGQNVTLFLGASGCTGCHAVSANGSKMVATPLTLAPGRRVRWAQAPRYTLAPGAPQIPSPLVASAPNATFVGLYPDGSLYVGSAHPNNGLGGPRSGGPGSTGPVNSGLYETDTRNAVANSGIAAGAMMPMFSPDGAPPLTFNGRGHRKRVGQGSR